MSAVFYHNDEQKKIALETKGREEARAKGEIFTELIPFDRFYLAEEYHQKYYLRKISKFEKELSLIYPNMENFIASTAVARINGYSGGYGTPEVLQEELSKLGLSPEANKKLLEIAGEGLTPGCALPAS